MHQKSKRPFIESKLPPRNNRRFDVWSILHLCMGILLGCIFSPIVAMTILVAWEPFEIFILSPLLARYKISFGYETFTNSISDIAFDALGVLIGYFLVRGVF